MSKYQRTQENNPKPKRSCIIFNAYANLCFLIKQPQTHTIKQNTPEATRSKFYFVETEMMIFLCGVLKNRAAA